jgi:hypothetical protein
VRVEYDRFAETSPLIPPGVIALFRERFANDPKYAEITFPEETNGLHAVTVYREKLHITPTETPTESPIRLHVADKSDVNYVI